VVQSQAIYFGPQKVKKERGKEEERKEKGKEKKGITARLC
jgi:hypothetical protein